MKARAPISLVGLAIMSIFAAFAGCSSANQGVSSKAMPASSKGRDSSTTTHSSLAETTTTTRGPLGSGEAVSIAFAGDSSFQGLGAAVINNPSKVLSAIASALGDADLTMVNLEAAVGSGGSPQPKTFTFQTPAQSLDALKSAGVDVVTMANNHGMDFGSQGLASSLQIKAAGTLPIIGIGANAEEAYAPFIAEAKGQKVGFVAANDVFDANIQKAWTATDEQPGIASSKGANLDRLVGSVKATRAKVDTLVVYLHYGRETETCPNERQRELVRTLLDAGADIVVGSHAHRLQGIGFLGDKFVAYGLGNFIFKPGSAVGRETGVLVVSATGARIDGYQWRPAVIEGVVPVPLTGQRAEAEMTKMAALTKCAGLSDQTGGNP